MTEQVLDCIGVPSYYMNVAISEPAGGGNVRVVNCVRKNGELIPVCEVIIPAVDLLTAMGVITETALLVFKRDQDGMLLSSH